MGKSTGKRTGPRGPFPLKTDRHEGYVYALRFDNGMVKVGQTRNPTARMRQHQDTADVMGRSLVEVWMSPAHATVDANERVLIAHMAADPECVANRANGRGEWFAPKADGDGGVYERAVSCGQGLRYTAVDRDAADRADREAQERVMATWGHRIPRDDMVLVHQSYVDQAEQWMPYVHGVAPDGSVREVAYHGTGDPAEVDAAVSRLVAVLGVTESEVRAMSYVDVLGKVAESHTAWRMAEFELWALRNGRDDLTRPTYPIP